MDGPFILFFLFLFFVVFCGLTSDLQKERAEIIERVSKLEVKVEHLEGKK